MKYNTFKVENKEDSGEDIASLSFTPDNEFYGKRRNICKSIKLKSRYFFE